MQGYSIASFVLRKKNKKKPHPEMEKTAYPCPIVSNHMQTKKGKGER